MIKILYVIGTLDYCNGITSYAMNYYNMLYNEFQIDFAVHEYENKSSEYYNTIVSHGSKVFFMGPASKKNLILLPKKIKNIFKVNDYDIVHCHLLNLSPFYFFQAKRYGIKNRILHSHATKYAEKKSRVFRNKVLGFFGKRMSTCNIACSKKAGDFLFKHDKYFVINNGIVAEKYYFNTEKRKNYRSSRGLNGFVIGHIGRFSEQKNHLFLLKVFNAIYQKKNDIFLVLVGSGPLFDAVMSYAKKLECFNNIIFEGEVKNINDILSGFDLIVLPSLFEGFPVVSVEAQFNGLPVLMSSEITKECKLNSNVNFIDLDENKWIDAILKNCVNNEKRCEPSENMYEYDIKSCYKEFSNIYKTIYLNSKSKIK